MKKWFLFIGLALFVGAFAGCKKSPTETKWQTFTWIDETVTVDEYGAIRHSRYFGRDDSAIVYVRVDSGADVGFQIETTESPTSVFEVMRSIRELNYCWKWHLEASEITFVLFADDLAAQPGNAIVYWKVQIKTKQEEE